MNREQIMQILPHRGSMLLLDEAWLDEKRRGPRQVYRPRRRVVF